MPVESGGNDVVRAIHTPPMQAPTSIAQIAIGVPALSWPGNMRAPNETTLAMRTIEATKPATASLAKGAGALDPWGPVLPWRLACFAGCGHGIGGGA